MPKKKGSRAQDAIAQRTLVQLVHLSEEDISFFEGFCGLYFEKTKDFIQAALARKLKLFHAHKAEEDASRVHSMAEESVDELDDDAQLLEEDDDPSNYACAQICLWVSSNRNA